MPKRFPKIVCLFLILYAGFFNSGSVLAISKSQQNAAVDSITNHVIILIDRSGTVYGNVMRESPRQLNTVINRALTRYLFNPGMIEEVPDRPLLQMGDYLSVMSFGFNKVKPSVDDFIEISWEGNDFGYYFKESPEKGDLNRLTNFLYNNREDFFRKNWTGLSFAGPLAIHELGEQTPPKHVNRTFLVVLTEGVSNNVEDPNNEILSIGWDMDRSTGKGVYIPVEGKNTIIPKYRQLRESYYWKNLFTYPPNSADRKEVYKFILWEYIPLQKTFAAEAVIPFETELTFVRTPHGYHENFLKLSPYENNDDFKIEKLRLTCYDSTRQKILFTEDYSQIYGDKEIPLSIQDEYIEDQLFIKAQFWVHFNDKIYNAHTLHPLGGESQGSKGLNRMIKVQIEPRATIYNVMPLWNIFYKPLAWIDKDQNKVARYWEIGIPIFIFIVTLIYFAIKSTIKKPPKNTTV